MSRNHAILILAHEDHPGLLCLVNRLRHSRIRTFIHLDRKNAKKFKVSELEHEGAKVISTHKVCWGGMSSCMAQMDLLRLALKNGDFVTYSLISGRDYPAVGMNIMVEELSNVQENRVDHWQDDKTRFAWRYRRLFFNDYPEALFLNLMSRFFSIFIPERRVPEGVIIYFGSTWWTLLNDGVDAIFRFCKERPDVLKWYQFFYAADESFFQTALMNVSNPPRVKRWIRRYIKFIGSRAHPEPISQKDLNQALSGEYWFLRKLDDQYCPGIRDMIDSFQTPLMLKIGKEKG